METLFNGVALSNVLSKEFLSGIMANFSSIVVAFAIALLKAVLVWIVGRWIIKKTVKITAKIMERRKVAESVRTFVLSLIDIVLLVVLILMVISILGVDTSSFIAIFASAGLAVGMALSGTLQNFAGGVMILIFRPYRVGDYIEAQGHEGTVSEIQIFNTILKTPDNRVILIPNGPISTNVIKNYSVEETRRVDFTFSVEYGSDFEAVRKVILDVIAKDSRVIAAPEPFVEISALGTSAVELAVRVWVKQADYWAVKFDLNKAVYEALPQNGFSFPYQTLTVISKDKK